MTEQDDLLVLGSNQFTVIPVAASIWHKEDRAVARREVAFCVCGHWHEIDAPVRAEWLSGVQAVEAKP